jgi:hypothetical protein
VIISRSMTVIALGDSDWGWDSREAVSTSGNSWKKSCSLRSSAAIALPTPKVNTEHSMQTCFFITLDGGYVRDY